MTKKGYLAANEVLLLYFTYMATDLLHIAARGTLRVPEARQLQVAWYRP